MNTAAVPVVVATVVAGPRCPAVATPLPTRPPPPPAASLAPGRWGHGRRRHGSTRRNAGLASNTQILNLQY